MKLSLFISICIFIAGCSGSKPAPHTQMAHSYGQSAYTCYNSGNFACALVNYDKALQHAGYSDEPLLQATYMFNIGRIYFELGRFDTAVQMFKTAATEYAFYKDSSYLRSTVAFIALSLALGGQTDSANLVRNQNVFMQNRESPVFYYTVLARIAFANGDLLQAESCLDSARYFIKKKSDPTAIALNCYYRAVLALSKKQYNESLVLLDSALQYLDNSPERFRRWKILSGLAAVYFCTNDSGAGFRYYNRAKECAPAGVTVPVIDEFKNCSYRP